MRRRFLALLVAVVVVGAGIAVWAGISSDVAAAVPSSPVDALSTGAGAVWVETGAATGQHLWSSTTDGRTWASLTPPHPAGTDVGGRQVVDRLHGWVVVSNRDGYDTLRGVARTTDGGRTWQMSTPPGCSACTQGSLTVFDAEHAYLTVDTNPSAEGMKLFSTVDGGATWRLASRSSRAADATWIDPQHGIYDYAPASPGGYVGGDQLSRTSDGGRTWTPISLEGQRSYNGLIGGIWTVGGSLVIPAERRHAQPVIYTSSDGGAHWQVHPVPRKASVADGSLFPRGLIFSTPTAHTWVTSDASWRHLFETRDAGKSWSVVKLPRPFWNTGHRYGMSGMAPQVQFSSANVGWAIVRNSELLRTTDGGRHWTQVSQPEPKRRGHR